MAATDERLLSHESKELGDGCQAEMPAGHPGIAERDSPSQRLLQLTQLCVYLQSTWQLVTRGCCSLVASSGLYCRFFCLRTQVWMLHLLRTAKIQAKELQQAHV